LKRPWPTRGSRAVEKEVFRKTEVERSVFSREWLSVKEVARNNKIVIF
jgi:hypothetical protein